MTLTILQVLFPVLLLALLVASHRALVLFGWQFRVLPWGIIIGLLGWLVYIYTGLRVGDRESMDAIRQFFVAHLLTRSEVLLPLCALLAVVLAVSLWAGIASETLAFAPTVEGDVRVFAVDEGEERLLGTASAKNLLIRRFFSGTRRFAFAAPGFERTVQDLTIGRSAFSARERRIPIELRPEAHFVLRDLSVEDRDGPPAEDFAYPDLENTSATTLFFTLASASPTPLWVQNLYLRLTEVTPRKEATFPYYGEGAPGPPPIHGFVVLKPEAGRYRVTLARKSKLGRGIEPDEFHIRTFCPIGYRYRVRIELQWTDMTDQRREGEYAFEQELQLDFPSLVEWKDLVRGSRWVKVLFYHFVDPLVEAFEAMQPAPAYTILIASPYDDAFARREGARLAGRIAVVPARDQKRIVDLAGTVPVWKRPRNLLLIDRHTLLLQDATRLDRAEIIQDPGQIADMEAAYDELANALVK